ncbi:MAG TPA: homoserine/homoserine lactone efflux protein [Plasticicumulans sp.]|uniref:homoserine/homoserine lactone efflux protein n=1 Tax=Plasticicumulans sp. TaxID=2307179 RepID=UPI002CD4A03B|nr:homoserine/homoserine lactone efflux protein [Plasticicumulans sp.]HMV40745.1 homoserine/homoserine lactone efflux protein [Plasticicumulans sp.]HMW29741.1 homoserine/homoserine lactone efflux protein [Plasticicumulans sp.]HMX53999.1 homoserine/homoserine lactone efflux protein [Plasticicumulans sp.]HMZ11800.1 homoserine/homoserine lactone efflux protein [Plasticicumulans sp.]HND99281.1 homoserine/homoserine lactone efflux protein [Plasticicumulans sp.]
MDLHVWLAWLAACVLISISPGAGAVNTMSNALSYGRRRTFIGILGLQGGLIVNTLLVGVGLGALIAASATAFTAIKWAGVAYLLWLGWQKWHAPTHFDVSEKSVALPGPARLFWQAVIVNVTNPKAIVFLVALFPQFLDPARPQGMQIALLGGTLVVVDVIVMCGYATLAGVLRRHVQNARRMRLLNRVFGGMFAGAGALLASVRHA